MTTDETQPTDQPEYPLLAAPADGVPPVIDTERALTDAARALADGHGPVALDAERASGFRYGNRAYLVQIHRDGSGTHLIDPIACPDLGPIQDVIGDVEWVLHAATQDLPCLAEVGLHPSKLFDTELGSRLAGLPRVGLASVVEHYVGVTLAKEHSAVDWSERPLPQPWLSYAALDVEVLVEVRDRLAADLESQGKADWAAQEFHALTSFTGPPQRKDPWRRTSGMHKIRNRRAIARVRELWQARDVIAQHRDTSPGRVLPDALLVEIANGAPTSAADLMALPGASNRRGRPHPGLPRYQRDWLDAVRRVGAMNERDLPPATLRSDAPPPQRVWADRDPVAAARLTQVREDLAAFGEEHHVPVENILTPDYLRRVLWEPSNPLDAQTISRELSELGAREWQVDIVTPMIEKAVAEHPLTGE
ncbi:ribonuclease D [Calidifontibacter indicus]|uniref:Ribonuclease D n=1 Tax=Calidifontibacter indicus TaxID=419650 RepID=A0A3D9UPJ7_9MICO|nr:ribonuclease D [Calidifontibacter indicus]REF31362.1 ribonuclease D [Calidifontibacter indicus]